MNEWLYRLGLSFIVTLGFFTPRAPAQAPLVPPSQPYDSSQSSPLVSILARPPLPQPAAPARPFMNAHGHCCDSSHFWYGCGGLRSQAEFVFGSCRTFFGEPCIGREAHPLQHKQGN